MYENELEQLRAENAELREQTDTPVADDATPSSTDGMVVQAARMAGADPRFIDDAKRHVADRERQRTLAERAERVRHEMSPNIAQRIAAGENLDDLTDEFNRRMSV